MRRHRWRLRTLALLATGGLSVGAGTFGIASAAGAPGSGFGALNLVATSSSMRSPFYNHAGEDVEGEVPYAEATLQFGGVGHGLASVFWPGGTGGHGGAVLQLLGPQCIPPNPNGLLPVPCATTAPTPPSSVTGTFNDSFKAEAQTGAGSPTSTKDVPGADMAASARSDAVTASASLTGSSTPGVGNSFGASSVDSTSTLTGAQDAVVHAKSSVRDVRLAAGVVTIGSVVSTAAAATNGVRGSGSGSTIVSDMAVAGIPVQVDNTGVHVQGAGAALPALTDQVNHALVQSGIAFYVVRPSTQVNGSNVSIDSGDLIVEENNAQYAGQGNSTGVVLQLGGATAVADAGPAFGVGFLPPFSLPAVTTGSSPAGSATTSVPGTAGTPGLPGQPATAGTAQSTGAPPALAGSSSGLPGGGLSPAWIVLVLAGSGLIAAGLKRLPDRLLEATASSCPLEDPA